MEITTAQPTIARENIVPMLETAPHEIFGLTYIKENGELRTAAGLLHVSNPKHALKPGTGLYQGESAQHALEVNGNLKYFDTNAPAKGGKGNYRTAKLSRIQTVTFRGTVYRVI